MIDFKSDRDNFIEYYTTQISLELVARISLYYQSFFVFQNNGAFSVRILHVKTTSLCSL